MVLLSGHPIRSLKESKVFKDRGRAECYHSRAYCSIQSDIDRRHVRLRNLRSCFNPKFCVRMLLVCWDHDDDIYACEGINNYFEVDFSHRRSKEEGVT